MASKGSKQLGSMHKAEHGNEGEKTIRDGLAKGVKSPRETADIIKKVLKVSKLQR